MNHLFIYINIIYILYLDNKNTFEHIKKKNAYHIKKILSNINGTYLTFFNTE